MKNPGYLFQWPPSIQRLPSSMHLELVVKGRVAEYTSIMSLLNLMDLSSNNLSGEIPEEMTNLSRLGSLNSTRNHLMGRIPLTIGNLQLLESLDLSWNHLSGPIPPSMSSLTSLSYLNLSHNNLSGQIPSTNQFQTLGNSWTYEGNLDLCGPQLPDECSSPSNSGNSKDTDADKDDDDDDHETLWFYVCHSLGICSRFLGDLWHLVDKKLFQPCIFPQMP